MRRKLALNIRRCWKGQGNELANSRYGLLTDACKYSEDWLIRRKIVNVTSRVEQNYQVDATPKSADVETGNFDAISPNEDGNILLRELLSPQPRVSDEENGSDTPHRTQ